MVSATITVSQYTGSLAGNALGGTHNHILSDIGSAQTGVFVDNDGTLEASDTLSTFNGDVITYLGAGTIQPGIKVLSATVAIGSPKPLGVFEAGGNIYFYYPEGPPALGAAVVMITDISLSVPIEIIPPVCFTTGTRVETETGVRAVETLRAGDRLRDPDGGLHEILWVLRRDIHLANCLPRARGILAPIRIPVGCLGAGLPTRELVVSPQHLVAVTDALAEMLFGAPRVLIPAKALLGFGAEISNQDDVGYYQFLCPRHALVRAEGLPSETLRLGPVSRRGLSAGQKRELHLLVPDLAAQNTAMRAAAPVLSVREGQALMAMIRADRPGTGYARRAA